MLIKSLTLGSLVLFGAGYYIVNILDCGVSVSCSALTSRGDAMFYGFGALAIVFVALILVPKAYSAWKEFAVWFLPPALAIFITYRDVGGFGNFLPYAENVFRFLAGAYIVCSLLVILWSFLSKKGKSIRETKPVFMPASPVARLAWYAYIALMVFYVIAHYFAS